VDQSPERALGSEDALQVRARFAEALASALDVATRKGSPGHGEEVDPVVMTFIGGGMRRLH
jgi:hypothetical protein